MLKKLIKVTANDFRLIFRDNSLKIFIILPLLTLAVVRYAVPYVVGIFEPLQAYIPVIIMLATTQGSTAFGFIYSMVLVDEKDTSVAKVYGVLPISKFAFVAFRLIPPFALASATTFLLLLVEPFYGFPMLHIFFYSILSGLFAPVMVIFVALLANNKIEAMTWQKLFNLPLVLPVLSLFIAFPLSFLFALSPTFWAYRSIDALINGGNFWLNLSIGYLHTTAFLIPMIKRLTKTHFR